MNEPTIRDGFTELGIFEKKSDSWVTSRDLARVFGKDHKNVIRDIDRIIEQGVDDFNRLNFEPVKYKDGKGEMRRACRMTRKGFSIAAMGFTGKKAMKFKVAYVEAFENMAELISARILAKEGYKKMSAAVAEYLGTDRLVFAEEANRVNRAVLGMSSADFYKVHGLKSGETPRDAIVKDKLDEIDEAQRMNAGLIRAGVSYQERERILIANFRD